MNTKSCILAVFISLLPISSFAQVEAEIHRPSINAEQFGFASKAEAALNKGQLSVNIPLMTLKGKGYDLPISLTFYSGDVTCATEASPIGLGWALILLYQHLIIHVLLLIHKGICILEYINEYLL